ncbi:MAG: hypothetical protein RL595_2300 [Planctomycetota bacterium]|jgi:hypothetical protein
MTYFRFAFVSMMALFMTFGLILGQEKDAKDKGKEKDKDKEKVEKPAPDSANKEKWVVTGQTNALIKEYRESDGSLVLSIQSVELNPQALQQMQQARMQGGKANPQQARMNLMKAQANLYKQKMEDVEFLLKDDVKIRQLLPPESFDEKGNKKRLSAKELAELKGPEKNLPGYPADRSDLNGNTLVQVTFSSKVQKQVAKTGNSGLAGIAAAKDDPETAREKRPRVSMIIITGKINENTKRN